MSVEGLKGTGNINEIEQFNTNNIDSSVKLENITYTETECFDIDNLDNLNNIEENEQISLLKEYIINQGVNQLQLEGNTPEYESFTDDINKLDHRINEIMTKLEELNKTQNFSNVTDNSEISPAVKTALKEYLYAVLGEQIINTNKTANINYENMSDDDYVIQGYTIVEDDNGDKKIIVTAHPKDETDENAKSRMYIYDEETGDQEGIIILDNKDHVGGVTYDKEHGIIFVAGSDGKVHTYDYDKMISILNESKKEDGIKIFDMNDPNYIKNYKEESVEIPNDISVLDAINDPEYVDIIGSPQEGMDSVYFFDDKLYSVTYSAYGELVCTEIKYDPEEGEVKSITTDTESYRVDFLNGSVQGLCFYKDEDGTKYLVTASSAGGVPNCIPIIGSIAATSRLTKWKMNEDGSLELVGYIYIDHSGLEGIEISDDGTITGVFEYGNQEAETLGNIDDFSSENNDDVDVFLTYAGLLWDEIIST